jgi:hypothetical protein
MNQKAVYLSAFRAAGYLSLIAGYGFDLAAAQTHSKAVKRRRKAVSNLV